MKQLLMHCPCLCPVPGLVTDVHSLNRHLIWNVGVAVFDADQNYDIVHFMNRSTSRICL